MVGSSAAYEAWAPAAVTIVADPVATALVLDPLQPMPRPPGRLLAW